MLLCGLAWGGCLVEAKNYEDDGPHPRLTQRDLDELLGILARPELDVLGPWRSNRMFLAEANERFVTGPYVLVDGFLDPAVADGARRELLALVERGEFIKRGPDFNTNIERSKAYATSASPATRCSTMTQSSKDKPPRAKYEELSRKPGAMHPKESPTLARLMHALSSDDWAYVLNMLMAGTGARMPPGPGQDATIPIFRQYSPGDYMELHSDVDRRERRVVAVNHWLTDGWVPHWGGGFLWCGPPGDRRSFPKARRLPPLFNQAVMFVLHSETLHAVEVVEADAQPRLSLVAWLRTTATYVDIGAHQEALRRRQEAMALAAAAPNRDRRPSEL